MANQVLSITDPHVHHWTSTIVSSRVLSPGRHPPSWYEISHYFNARRSTHKNCTGWQIICRCRPSYLEQSATQHSWFDTVGGNIRNTAEKLLVCLGTRRWCFWTSASEMYITIWYDHTATADQVSRHGALELNEGDNDCLSFWQCNNIGLNQLFLPVLSASSVPASSSTVQRIFNQGGLILCPQRARMGDNLLSQLIFLKCNRNTARYSQGPL